MKQMDFNTMDNLAGSDTWKELAEKAQESIKGMQTPIPEIEVPSHVVLPIFQKQEDKQYVLAFGNEQKGPFSASQIKELLKAGTISSEFYVWAQGWQEWKKIMECPQFTSI
jgi:hypothetical protein